MEVDFGGYREGSGRLGLTRLRQQVSDVIRDAALRTCHQGTVAVALQGLEELPGKDWLHMGHDELLLGLVWGPRVLLAKAQTDLVLRLSVTILQVGAQFGEEAARVEQLTGALTFQLVGLHAVRGPGTGSWLIRPQAPPTAIRCAPGAAAGAAAGGRRAAAREANLRDRQWRPQQALRGGGGCPRAQMAALGLAHCGFAHQLDAVEQPHVQPAI